MEAPVLPPHMTVSWSISAQLIWITLEVVLLFNAATIAAYAAILVLWGSVFLFIFFAAFVILETSAFPRRFMVDFSLLPLLWLVAPAVFCGKESVEWSGSLIEFFLMSLLIQHIKANMRHWSSMSYLANAEMVAKSSVLFVCSALHFTYLNSLADVNTQNQKRMHHVALVGMFYCVVEGLNALVACCLMMWGLNAMEQWRARFFPNLESLRQTHWNPTDVGYSFTPSLISQLAVLMYCGILVLTNPSPSLEVILLLSTVSYHLTRNQKERYQTALDGVPLITAKETTTCCICFESITVGQAARQLPCQHMFHSSCIRHWMLSVQSRTGCPMCRGPVVGGSGTAAEQSPINSPAPNAVESQLERRGAIRGVAAFYVGDAAARRSRQRSLLALLRDAERAHSAPIAAPLAPSSESITTASDSGLLDSDNTFEDQPLLSSYSAEMLDRLRVPNLHPLDNTLRSATRRSASGSEPASSASGSNEAASSVPRRRGPRRRHRSFTSRGLSSAARYHPRKKQRPDHDRDQ